MSLKKGEIIISRARQKVCFPAQFQLIAAMNPSPCGHIGQQSRTTLEQIRRYLNRLSGQEIYDSQRFSLEHIQFLEMAVEKMNLSVRSFHRLQRVALTIADLNHSDHVQRTHIAQALSFRAMDKLLKEIHD